MTNQPTEADEQVSRDYAKALFGGAQTDEPDEPAPPDPRPANFVQTEGANPSSKDAGDVREFVRALFYPDPED